MPGRSANRFDPAVLYVKQIFDAVGYPYGRCKGMLVSRKHIIAAVVLLFFAGTGPAVCQEYAASVSDNSFIRMLELNRSLLDQDSGNTSSLSDLGGTASQKHRDVPSAALSGWILRSDYFSLYDKQYLEEFDQYLYRWREQTVQLQARHNFGSNRSLSFGVLDGSIRQYSLVFDDYDFRLRRRGLFAQIHTSLYPGLTLQTRLRYETFDNDGSGYYRLDKPEELLTGFAVLTRHMHRSWLSLSYSRERDPEPVYDLDSGRAELNIGAQELSGINYGHRLGSATELVASVYYEAYASDRPAQWNGNLHLLWHPAFMPQFQVAAGSGYYTQERETIFNTTLNWKQPLSAKLALEFEYQLEHAVRDNSLLHQGEVFITTRLGHNWTFSLQLTGGQEYGEDEDRFVQLAGSIQWVF